MSVASSLILYLAFVTIAFVVFIWGYSVRKFDHWKKRGVYHPRPIPFVGNLGDVVLMKKCIGEWVASLYFSTSEKFFGVFMFDEPILVLRDPRLIQLVLIKDSDHFKNRGTAEASHDAVMHYFTFTQKGANWARDRKKLTPVFTSGKLKGMFPIIYGVGEDMVKNLERKFEKIEAKDICARYSTNVIAKCAFGIDAHCFDEKESAFRKYGREMLEFSLRNITAQMIYFIKQTWVTFFRIDLFPRAVIDYFTEAFTHTMKSREMSNTRVNDFVDLLIDLKNSGDLSKESEEKRACGHAITFFIAGFETTSAVISFTLYELCLNTDIQDELRASIFKVIKKHGSVTYEAVQEMKYLKSCIYETLRKYPVLPYMDRECTTDYQIPGTNLVIEEGMKVCIPVGGLHMDEKYFPEPQVYNPERFMEKTYNMDGIFYLPFGEGPRNCLGERFGLLSTQLALIHILTHFEAEKCAETPYPVEFTPKCVLYAAKDGLPMRLKKLANIGDS